MADETCASPPRPRDAVAFTTRDSKRCLSELLYRDLALQIDDREK
jgi:hypothetical protein